MFLIKITFLFFNCLSFVNSGFIEESIENIYVLNDINDEIIEIENIDQIDNNEINNLNLQNQQAEIMNFAFSQIDFEQRRELILLITERLFNLLPYNIQDQVTSRFISNDHIYNYLFPNSIQEEVNLISARWILETILPIAHLINNIANLNLQMMLNFLPLQQEEEFIWNEINFLDFVNNFINYIHNQNQENWSDDEMYCLNEETINYEENDNDMIIPKWLFNN